MVTRVPGNITEKAFPREIKIPGRVPYYIPREMILFPLPSKT
jgi:hypothetical protein